MEMRYKPNFLAMALFFLNEREEAGQNVNKIFMSRLLFI
jgi:hypothetical protein